MRLPTSAGSRRECEEARGQVLKMPPSHIRVPATALRIQSAANVSWEAADQGLSDRGPANHVEQPNGVLAPGFSLATAGYCGHLKVS